MKKPVIKRAAIVPIAIIVGLLLISPIRNFTIDGWNENILSFIILWAIPLGAPLLINFARKKETESFAWSIVGLVAIYVFGPILIVVWVHSVVSLVGIPLMNFLINH